MKTSKPQTTSKQKKISETGNASKSKKVTTVKTISLSEEKIRDKAKEIYKERIERGEQGTAVDDWLKAEELMKRPKK